uniref:Chloroplast protein-transporting ATPase n=1 Tax=Panagrellus redivivus TaxID=6233 RepID=A0A7E4ZVN0_PANRE
MHKLAIDPGDINMAYSPEELRLLVTTSIADDVLFDELLNKIGNANDVSTKHVKKQYELELLRTVKAAIKLKMSELVIDGNKAFIKEARNGITMKCEWFTKFTQKLVKNDIMLTDERLGHWVNDFKKYYNFLENRFVKCDQEETLKNLIVEWFEDGEMSLDIWKTWFVWFHKYRESTEEISLKSLQEVQWPSSSRKDTIRPRFLDALSSIEAADFLETDGLRTFLELQLEAPKIEVETREYINKDGNKTMKATSTLNVTGRNIFLSVIKDTLEAKMKTMRQIDIIVNNTLYIDCDFTGAVWQGKNIAITANKINVNGKHTFDVSGMGFPKNTTVNRARDGKKGIGKEAGGNGQNGSDGRAGESSGNIKIMANDMSYPELLTLKLVGGDGENGESGGNGGDGADGYGVTEMEFKKICPDYGSMYWTQWAHFKNYHPNGWTKTVNEENENCYVHYVFEDSHKRKLFFDYSVEDASWYQMTRYDLILWIKGSDGTLGGIGGLNGIGGEGGNNGECVVINPDTNDEYPVQKIQHKGDNGLDGTVGECGKPGLNGNDMAVIDRSVGRNESKHHYGTDRAHRLMPSYSHDNGHYKRLNRYRKEREGDPFCYAKFNYGTLKNDNLRQQTQEKKKERSSEARMKMKQSIVLSRMMEKAQKHKHEMDSVMATTTASMHEQKFKAFEVDDEVEAEAVAEMQHEVIIVKEFDEDKLDGPNARTRKSQLSPKEYVAEMLNQANKNLTAQQIIDYFFIEFDEETLQSLLKGYPQFKHADTLEAAIQNQKSSNFDFNKLKILAACFNDHTCSRKRNLTHLRATVTDFPVHCHRTQLPVTSIIEKVNDKIHHVKFVDPGKDKLWHFEADSAKIKNLLDSFFNDSTLYKVDSSTLAVIEDIFKVTDSLYGHTFANFKPTDDFWKSEETWKKFKESFPIWHPNIKLLLSLISGNYEWLTSQFRLLKEKLNQSPPTDEFEKEEFKELQLRLGIVPDFHHNSSKNLEAAHYLIRFHWQMKALLQFNRRLLIVTLMHHGEASGDTSVSKSYTDLTLNELIVKVKLSNIDLGSDSSSKYMRDKGFRSLAYRYLVSEMHKLYIEHYGNEKYGTIELMDVVGTPTNTLVRLYDDGERFYNIVSDDDLKRLLQARQFDNFQDKFEGFHELINSLPYDYSTIPDKERFASFFPTVFASTVFEWLDCYVTTTDDIMFLKMFHLRFELDGNHLEIADFQFIISSAILLQIEFGCSAEFIFNFAASVDQSRLVDEFVILRIESLWRKQFQASTEILQMLNEINNNRFKILLVTKLESTKLEDEQLMKLLIMIRHTSLSNTELEKMSLNDIVKASERQELTTLNEDVKELGKIGYYIIYLRRHNKLLDACKLENLLTKHEFHIPEKLIAEVCMLVADGEIEFDVQLLEKLLHVVTNASGITKIGTTVLITGETEQRRMISTVENTPEYKMLFSDRERDLDTVARLIRGIRDEDKMKRLDKSLNLVAILNDKSQQNVYLLHEIDDCIFKLRNGIRLRDTQKLAIMYAVQSDTNLLAQVNTGEGKSYIVAAVAIIRAKTYQFVDVITSSPVLAQRDAEELKDIYSAMGVAVGHNCHENMDERKSAYKAQVVYGEIGRFQSDYLLHSFYGKNILGERDRSNSCVIVDEVDSMLLDNGNNMLYLSHTIPGMDLLEPLFVHLERIIWSPNEDDDDDKALATDFIRNEILSDLLGHLPQSDISMTANSEVEITNSSAIWARLITAQIIDEEGYVMIDTDFEFERRKCDIVNLLNKETTIDHAKKILVCIKTVITRPREIDIPRYLVPFCRQHLTEYIENAKRAYFMKPNEAYVIDTDRTGTDSDLTPKVTIIDQNTGVDLASSQWSGGLHQFIQIKHGCRTNPVSMKAVFVSNVSYLKGYGMINGLSGTLGSAEESNTLVELYGADLIKIPTFKHKRLYEHVPVIANDEKKWLDALFEEIANQTGANRSVLVIVQSIDKVIAVEGGLLYRYETATPEEKCSLTCFNNGNMMVYKREHDEFKFGNDDKLQPGKLILATNLAGRGTDIKLSDALKDAGGLHVIVSFLPENSRIEDQAYGRAARCGDPGSCQIIAFTDQVDARGQPLSVFDLKLFRDNAEVQRLQSLTSYYNYHTKIEEDCLSAFKQCYLTALTQKNNCEKKSANNHKYSLNALSLLIGTKIEKADDTKGIPTEAEILYFAFLDEWALWLDSQADAIKKCAQDRSQDQRKEIIDSVNHFLHQHPIESIEKALQWIKCPQPMLALGICRIDQNKLAEASEIFNKVIEKFPQFTGDACYYLGIIAQKGVRKAANPQLFNYETKIRGPLCKVVKWATEDLPAAHIDLLDDEMGVIDDAKRIETEDYLLQAIQGFNRRVERKQEQHTIVSRLQQAGNPGIVKSDGFQRQMEDLANVYEALSVSAYDMIGHPISFATFAKATNDIEKQFEAQKLFLKCLRAGYITEKAINHNILDDQCEPLKEKYMLSKRKLQKLFKDMARDKNGSVVYKRMCLNESVIRKQCSLPSREEFWKYLLSKACFAEHQELYVLNTDGVTGSIDELGYLKAMNPPRSSPLRIQLSDFDLSMRDIYDGAAVEEAFEANPAKLEWLIEMNYLVKDASAVVNRDVFDQLSNLPDFGYFTGDDFADWLEIPVSQAEWVADLLLQTSDIDQNGRNVYKVTDDFDCSALPKCLRSSVEAFFYNQSMYSIAYKALRHSLDEACTNPNIRKPILLPWKPHDDLLNDLIKYGFIHDHKLEIRNKDKLDKRTQCSLQEVEDNTKSRLFVKTGRLMSTEKYLKKLNVAASIDVQNQAIHNIRHVGKIDDNHLWIFWFAVKLFITCCVRNGTATVLVVFNSDIKRLISFVKTSLMVTASTGTLRYFRQLFKAHHRTQTKQQNTRERYSRLINFHSKNIETAESVVQEAKLAQVVTLSFIKKLNDAFKEACILDDGREKLCASLRESKLTTQQFIDNTDLFLAQQHNWNIFMDIVQNILTRITPKLCKNYFNAVNEHVTAEGLNVQKAVEACQTVDEELNVELTRYERQLFRSLLSKILDDTAIMLVETQITETELKEMVDRGSSETETDAVGKFISNMKSMAINKYESEITSKVSEPLNAAFNKYIASVKKVNKNLTDEFEKVLEAQMERKSDVESRNRQIVAHQSAPYIVKDLQEAVRRKFALQQSDKILKLVIRYGHAMEPVVMKNLVKPLYCVLNTYLSDLGNVKVVLNLKTGNLSFLAKQETSNNTRTVELLLDASQGHFYICQEDSRKTSMGTNDTEYIGSCFYESIAKEVPEASNIARQGAGAFRNSLLQLIEK